MTTLTANYHICALAEIAAKLIHMD